MSDSATPKDTTPQDTTPEFLGYGPGHHMHFIHAGHLGRRPWGWREGVVRSSHDGHHVIDYVLEDGSVTVWSALCPELAPGTAVRVHEEFRGLDVAGRWFNVRRVGPGLGPVPEPVDPSAWADEQYLGLVDHATGEGIGPQARQEEV